MALISDSIELFIKELLAQSDHIELQRNELAAYFGCAPSQINYVLTTRFPLEKGYIITSKRGGGGSITIVRVDADEGSLLNELLSGYMDDEVTQNEALAIIDRLLCANIISKREADLMQSVMGNLPMVQRSVGSYVRGAMLKRMLLTLVKE